MWIYWLFLLQSLFSNLMPLSGYFHAFVPDLSPEPTRRAGHWQTGATPAAAAQRRACRGRARIRLSRRRPAASGGAPRSETAKYRACSSASPRTARSRSICAGQSRADRRFEVTLGQVGKLTLDAARQEASALQNTMAQGLGPRAEKAVAKARRRTLGEIAAEYVHLHSKRLKESYGPTSRA